MSDWNPQAYLAFANERQRPAADLLARVPLVDPKLIYDLGSGPGNSTSLLRARYPEAHIIGVESSPAMIEKARASVPSTEFIKADVAKWLPDPGTDLIYSNALFHWLPDHMQIFQTLLAMLDPGAVLAIQMPDNLGEPSHKLMIEVATSPKWKSKAKPQSRQPLHQPTEYFSVLSQQATTVDVWRTGYHHVVQGHQGIADFFSTTGLKPYIDHLSTDDQQAFITDYVTQLELVYPKLEDDKVLFALPRLFILVAK